MYTLLKSLQVREELLKRKLRIFTVQDFMRIFKTTPTATKHLLVKQVKDEFLLRLKRGIYTLKTDPATEEEIANTLYKPSYISFEYALAFHNLLPEMPYTVTSATTKPTRQFNASGKSFSYRIIKKEFYTGYILINKENTSFFMAEKEKAFIDYLYFVSIGKISQNDRLIENFKNSNYDKIKINSYTKLFRNQKLAKLVQTYV